MAWEAESSTVLRLSTKLGTSQLRLISRKTESYQVPLVNVKVINTSNGCVGLGMNFIFLASAKQKEL